MEPCVEQKLRVLLEAPKVGQRVGCPEYLSPELGLVPACDATVVSVADHPGPGDPHWVGADYVWVQVKRDDGRNPIYWGSTKLIYEKD